MKLVPAFCCCLRGGLCPTLLGPSSVAAAGKPCRRRGISGVSWGIHRLRDRRSRTNSLTSKIAEEWRWAGHTVGTSHAQVSLDVSACNLLMPCCSVEGGNILVSSPNITADSEAQGPHQPRDPASCLLLPHLHHSCSGMASCIYPSLWERWEDITEAGCEVLKVLSFDALLTGPWRPVAGGGGGFICLEGRGRVTSAPAQLLLLS